MPEVLMTPFYDPRIILLSAGMAFLGSYITICLCEQYRLSTGGRYQPKFISRHGYLWSMALALGGIGIWCMHFVGMSSMKLVDPFDSRIDVNYYLFPTLLSLAMSILFAYGGLWYASHDVMFGKTKEEIVELYKSVNSQSGQSRRPTSFKMLLILTTHSPQHLLIGGLIAGMGVSVMHYLGMWGMRFNDGMIDWHAGIIAASVIIAMVAATAAFWILFRLLSVYPHLEYLRVLSALIMAIAVTGMHFTGMVAAEFEFRPNKRSTQIPGMSGNFDSKQAFRYGLLMAVIIGVVLIMIAFAELRATVYHQATDLRGHEQFVAFLRSDERYTAYVKKWFPTFAMQRTLSSLLQERTVAVSERSGAWSFHSRATASKPEASTRSSVARVVPSVRDVESGAAPSAQTNDCVELFERVGCENGGDSRDSRDSGDSEEYDMYTA